MINNICERLKNLYKNLQTNSGVTLIEIMIVVTIIALLGALVIPRLLDNVKIAKTKAAKIDITTFETVLDTYYMQRNSYPSTEEGLQKLVQEGKIKKKKNVLNDPWGNPYQYRSPGENEGNDYEIWSYGQDGKPGGEGFDKDIKSWE